MALTLQEAQFHLGAYIDFAHAKSLEAEVSFTALGEDGVPIACAGIIEVGPGRAMVWSYLGALIGREFLLIHRAVKRFIDLAQYRRIEATTDVEFAEGHRWLRMLGFECEAPKMKSYTIDGRDAALYAKVK